MKKLYFECNMGAAGDMLMAALLELHPDPEGFVQRLNNVGIPDVEIEKIAVTKCGIQGTGVSVRVHGQEEDDHLHDHHHDHDHEHEHGHHHEHHHTGMHEIASIIADLKISDKVKKDVAAVYELIAQAESHAHGRPVDQIHFHEVGSMDAVADITGVCMLIEELAPDKIVTSPIHVGCGQVRCAHGLLPVPAPATAHILQGVPTYGGAVQGELCTPTGAALLKYFTDEFVSSNSMTVNKIGYGMGKRHFHDQHGTEILSAVRAMIGEEGPEDEILMLSCNLDDMTGEQLGFAVEQLMDRGARDVFATPIYMKKNRPGILLTVICDSATKDEMVKLIFKHTTTLGVREQTAKRHILDRSEEIRSTPYGDVRVKMASGYGVSREKAEYEDLRKIAIEKDISIDDIEI